MRAVVVLSFLVCVMPGGGMAQTEWSGRANVIDGDSLYVGRAEVRLYGIDSPDHGQRCEQAGGGSWACDEAAKELLKRLAQDRTVACEPEGLDRNDRVIAMCWADGIDLGEKLVTKGLSWANRDHSTEYAAAEVTAQAEERGIWENGARPAPPWEFRAEQSEGGPTGD